MIGIIIISAIAISQRKKPEMELQAVFKFCEDNNIDRALAIDVFWAYLYYPFEHHNIELDRRKIVENDITMLNETLAEFSWLLIKKEIKNQWISNLFDREVDLYKNNLSETN